MFKINGNVIVDLTPYVDIKTLLELKPYIDYAIVKNSDYQVPAEYAGYLFFNPSTGFIDISDKTKQEFIEKYPFLKDLDYKKMLMWLRYHIDIKYGQSHLHVTKANTWETKHLKSECALTPVTESFKPLLDWIENQNIFLEYGRVNIFVNEPNCNTPRHHDPPTNLVSAKDQFIWITLDSRKKFFVYDPATEEKHYLSGHIGIFDNYNYHGSESSDFASYSIRIDGRFTSEFLKKTGMAGHF